VLQSLLNSGTNLTRGEIIEHLAGSSRTHPHSPQTSVKKAFSHDGPTPQDATTHEKKNNLDNHEGGRDGNEMPGTNWGPESSRVQRFLMAMLGLSQGVPMTCLGHERGKSQGGNTNAYCQDNDISYIPWGDDITPEGKELMAFQKQINHFRKNHSSLRRASHFSGKEDDASELLFSGNTMKDVTWLHADGTEIEGGKGGPMDHAGGFAMLLSGDPGNSKPTEKHFTRLVQRTQRDDPLLVLVNPTMDHNIEFTLPNVPGVKWQSAINTRNPDQVNKEIPAGQKVSVDWRSVIAFKGQRYLERGTQARAAAR
jgi:glycogen operon protein